MAARKKRKKKDFLKWKKKRRQESSGRPEQPGRFLFFNRPSHWALARMDKVELSLYSFFLALIMIPLGSVLVGYYHFSQDLPEVAALKEEYRPKTVSSFYAADGRLISEFYRERRLVRPLDSIPKHVVLSFIAAEDANFFNHPGVDFLGAVRAFIKNWRAGRIVQGGSTITQQVTRTFLLSQERTYSRKVKEAILAYRLEKNLTKSEILNLYLNQIYLGEGAYGVQAAALEYFNKDVDKLNLAEAALIAGLTKSPSRLSPFRNPAAAKKRQLYVLKRLTEAGFFGEEETRAAAEAPLNYQAREPVVDPVPEFTEHVRREVEALLGRDTLYDQGIRVYTTVDVTMQRQAREAVRKGLAEISKRQGSRYRGPIRRLSGREMKSVLDETSQGGLEKGRRLKAVILAVDPGKRVLTVKADGRIGQVTYEHFKWALRGRKIDKVFTRADQVMVKVLEARPDETPLFSLEPFANVQAAFLCQDLKTGDVRAMVGSRDFNESQFNRAVQARRQPGSAFKPFVYATAIERGFSPADLVLDEPIYEDDQVVDLGWNQALFNEVTLYEGLVRSRNNAAVRLMGQVGAENVIKTARRMGITSRLRPYPSLALGAFEVTLLEMVSAFTTFPNLGRRVHPRFITRIEDRNGRIMLQFDVKADPVMDPASACVMLHMLKGVVEEGTGRVVKALGRPAGGKTGTTNDSADAWFVGFTPDYAAGVWVGRDLRKRLGWREEGGKTAAPIFLYFFREALKDKPKHEFQTPPGVIFAMLDDSKVCFKSGGWGSDDYYGNDIPDYNDLNNEPEHVRIIFEGGKYKVIREPLARAPVDREDLVDNNFPEVRPDLPAVMPEETPEEGEESVGPAEHVRIEFDNGKYYIVREPIQEAPELDDLPSAEELAQGLEDGDEDLPVEEGDWRYDDEEDIVEENIN